MKTDLIIIGAGPGGYRAAEYAAKNGLQVVIAEAEEVGGTCLNCLFATMQHLSMNCATQNPRD